MASTASSTELKDWSTELASWNWNATPAEIAKYLISLDMHPHDESDKWANFETQFMQFYTNSKESLETITDIVEIFS